MFTKALETSLNFLAEPFDRQVIKPGTHIVIIGQPHTGRSMLATHIARDLLLNNPLEDGVLYMHDEGETSDRVRLFPEDKRSQLLVERLFVSHLDNAFVFNYINKHEPRPVLVLDLMTLDMAKGVKYDEMIKAYCKRTGAVVISIHAAPSRNNSVSGAILNCALLYSYLDANQHEQSNTIPVFTGQMERNEPMTADFLPFNVRTHKSAEEVIANYTVCVPRI